LSRESRSIGLGGRPLGADSLLLGGRGGDGEGHAPEAEPRPQPGYDPAGDQLAATPVRPGNLEPPADGPTIEQLRELLPAPEEDRNLDDWGRSERVVSALDPLLNFYYRYWFRVEAEGVDNVPADGGALLVCNHSGALPPDAPMIMQAIRNEHPHSRPVYMLGEHWFKGYPLVSAFVNKVGVIPAHPANAQRLLADEGRLALVFPEGMKGSRKVLWQRYRLRRFGRGGFVRAALRARVPIVPIALVGGEEAMPIFAHLRALERLTGLLYAPLNHAFPHFGPLAALMYMPAKFRIRFLEPIDVGSLPADTVTDAAAVQSIAEDVRARIQTALEELLAKRRSVWLG
jgi:1-acyl-sn-glycerol-3-phosphate acyltransferase